MIEFFVGFEVIGVCKYIFGSFFELYLIFVEKRRMNLVVCLEVVYYDFCEVVFVVYGECCIFIFGFGVCGRGFSWVIGRCGCRRLVGR